MAGERVLIVDDEPGMQRLLIRILHKSGLIPVAVGSGEEAIKLAGESPFDLAILDIHLTGMNGLDTLREIKKIQPALDAIMITAYGTVKSAVTAMRHGAYDYITKPFHVEEIRIVVEKALEHRRLLRENEALQARLQERIASEGIVCPSPRMHELYDLVRSVAPSNASVLIEGETGTGKELVARMIHRLSRRAEGPMVVLSCSALAEGVLESELFGHEKGAFTGAIRQRPGRFEQAHGGTLFLDEVGEIPLATQVKLLRVLQSGEFERVGGTKPIHVDVRIVAATNRSLKEAVAAGRFREDLFYRLNVVHLEVPPLRDRNEDIDILAGYFLSRFAAESGKSVAGISEPAMDALQAHTWPGNVRELQNVIERAVVFEKGAELSPTSLPGYFSSTINAVESRAVQDNEKKLDDILTRTEREMLIKALEAHGSQTAAAEALGIKRSTLRYKLEKHGLIAG